MTKQHLCTGMRASVAGLFLTFCFSVLCVNFSYAGPLTFAGSSGNRSASVAFDQTGNQLSVTVVNTSTADVLKPVDILTAVFFSLAGNPSLTPVSAVVPNGSVVLFGTTDPGGVVGGEWAYRSFPRAVRGANQGISSAAAGGFGRSRLFPGSNLQGPTSAGRIEYGITSAGDKPTTGSKAVTGQNALIQDSVVFTLLLPTGYEVTGDDLSNVSFQYGGSLGKKKNLGAFLVPEPSTWLLLGSSLLLLPLIRRRYR